MKTSDSSKPNKATKRVAIGLVIVLAGKKAEKKDTAAPSAKASFLKKVSLSELQVKKGGIGLDSRDYIDAAGLSRIRKGCGNVQVCTLVCPTGAMGVSKRVPKKN